MFHEAFGEVLGNQDSQNRSGYPTCSDKGKVEVKSILNLVSASRSILSTLLESSKQVVLMKLWPVSDMTVTTCVQFFS